MRVLLLIVMGAMALGPEIISAATAQQPVGAWTQAPAAKLALPALGGYCVVTLHDRQQWQPGDERWSVYFDGRRYQFATVRERDIFASSPETYVPMLRGDCPVTFAESGERKPGRLECGVLHGSRIVFFAGEDERRLFLESPEHFTNVDLTLGGECIVSRRIHGKNVAGIPETVAMFRGMRYFFASAHDRLLFLKHPGAYTGDKDASDAEASPLATIRTENGQIAAPDLTAKPRGGSKSGENSPDVILGALPSMAGYCPVTLQMAGTWVRGRYEHRVDLGGFVFLTAGPKERELLSKEPEKYAPALGGDCAVTLMARGEHVRGSVYHAYEYDGRLFLFADAERKALFKASPAKYALADVAAEGNCVVTAAEEKKTTPGLVDQATWFRGKLYRFASAERKQAFLANPKKYAEPD